MSTIFDWRNLKAPSLSRAAVIVGGIVAVLALVAGYLGWQLYQRLTTTTVVAYFTDTLALYPGDKVQVMGVQVGAIDSIEPAGDRMKVTLHYDSKYKVPANATASILNPSLVASRNIQLSPPYTGGPELEDGAVIPIERTQVPVEYDDLRDSLSNLVSEIGPTPEQPRGPLGEVIESFADGLAGKGEQINATFTSLSEALFALNQGRGDFFAVVRSLALFVNALYQSDQQIVALNEDVAGLTAKFTNTDQELATAVRDLNDLFESTQEFFERNGEVLTADVNNLAEVTNALLQPEPFSGLETGLHVFPTLATNVINIAPPVSGGVASLPVINNFANPLQFLCSSIQAGSRLGYQDSAELCAQYLTPILDAIKFNYLPFGLNQFTQAHTLPKMVAYSEERLRPPPGYKDTTVPGIWSRDTLFSHGNHEPGWIAAPDMQGVEVQPFTANMMTPDCLAELLGGPNCATPAAPPAFGTTRDGNLPGPPNAFDQNNPLPPPWYPGAPPVPAQPPGVSQVPQVAPAPVSAPGPGSAPPPPAPGSGPPLPAEAGA